MVNCRSWFISPECGQHHGNFIAASYRAILRSQQWRKRLQKVHSQGRRSLPASDGLWRELDSSMSSDALLMNIFCYPGVTRRLQVCRILGLESGSLPEFGFTPRVPLFNKATERTEVDMKLGSMLLRQNSLKEIFKLSVRNWSSDTETSWKYSNLANCQEPRKNTSRISSYATFSRHMRSMWISAPYLTLAGQT
jgi:hypothetical protein